MKKTLFAFAVLFIGLGSLVGKAYANEYRPTNSFTGDGITVTSTVSGSTTTLSTLHTFGTKLRNAMAGAAANNYNINAPLAAPISWASSTAYYLGNVISANGSNYVETASGMFTSTSSNLTFPATATTSPIVDGSSTWNYIGPTFPSSTAYPYLPAIISTTTLPSTVIPGTNHIYNSATTTGNTSASTTLQDYINWTGGLAYSGSGAKYYFVDSTLATSTGANCGQWFCVENQVSFMTDSPVVAIRMSGGAFTPSRFVVNGHLFQVSGVTASGSNYYNILDMRTMASTQKQITILEGSASGLLSITVASTSQIWQPATSTDINADFIGDSIISGGGLTVQEVLTGGLSWPEVLDSYLGISHSWNQGQGGTGFIQVNGYAGTFGNATRIQDIYNVGENNVATSTNNATSTGPDIIFVSGGVNDIGNASATVGAAAQTYFNTLYTDFPNTPIIVIGSWTERNVTSTQSAVGSTSGQQEAAIQTAIKNVGDPNMYWIPATLDPNGPWLYGTGYITAQNQSGNTDNYVGADGVHPSDYGLSYFASRIYTKVANIIQNLP